MSSQRRGAPGKAPLENTDVSQRKVPDDGSAGHGQAAGTASPTQENALADSETWDDMDADHAAGLHVDEMARRGYHGDLEGCGACMDYQLAAEERAADLLATIREYDVGDLRHFAARVIQDAMAEADAA